MSPDVSLIEGVNTLPLPKLGTYRFAQYGGRCLLGVEIVSPDTRGNDVDLKPDLYHRGGVRQYVIVDQERQEGPRSVVSRRWTPDGYVVEPPDANGRVRLDALGLLLGLRDNRVRLYDADTGEEIGDPVERSAALRKAEERVRQLEEELRRRAGTSRGEGGYEDNPEHTRRFSGGRMSTPNLTTPPTTAASVTPPAEADRFRYGWRYVNRKRKDGNIEVEEVPLSLEDVLHPQEGDVIPEITIQESERGHLAGAFRTRLFRVRNGQVFSDCLLDFNVAGLRPLSPDVSVIEGVNTLPLPPLGTYRIAQFGGRCLLAFEIVAPDTRTNDVDRKPDLYHRGGVQQYVIVDQEREGGPRQIASRRWTPDGYVIVTPDAQGRVRLDSVGLLIGLRDNRVAVFDEATGDELREYADEYAARRAAEERVQGLEEELRRLRGNPPT